MSVVHFWFGAVVAKSPSNKLGATGWLLLVLVVCLYRFFRLV